MLVNSNPSEWLRAMADLETGRDELEPYHIVSIDFVRGDSDGLHSAVDELTEVVNDFDVTQLRQAG